MGFEELLNGFDLINNTISDSTHFSEDICKFFTKFISLTRDYGKGLQQLAKNKDSINIKYNSVQSAWISIQTNTENIGKIFLELSDVIQKSIEQIQMDIKESKKKKKPLTTNGQKMMNDLLKAESNLNKIKSKVFLLHKKKEESLEEYNKAKTTQTANIVTKLGKKADNDTKNFEKSSKEYQKTVENVKSFQEKVYQQELPIILKGMQEIEEQTIQNMKNWLNNFIESQKILPPKLTNAYETISNSVKNINAKEDINNFILQNKTQDKVVYVTYESPSSSMNENLSNSYNNNSNVSTPNSSIEVKKVIALYDYNANDENELSFKINDVITIIEKNDSGWWQGELNGKIGIFPSTFVKLEDNSFSSISYKLCQSLYEYSGQDSEELSMKVGEQFSIVSEIEGWYYVYNSEGNYGRIPSNYVELL